MTTDSSEQPRTGGPSHPTERDSQAHGRGAAGSRGGIPVVFELRPGVRPLPEYELVRKIGAGGFGEVWEALGPGGVPTALKFIRLGERASEAELRSLELMKKIRHPHLIGISGAWQRDGMLIIAMDLGDCTLMHRLLEAQKNGSPGIPPRELLEYMRDAARGLDHLHINQIQHRDIKPHNLLIVGGGLKVADFGLAKLLHNQGTTNSGMLTPAYAAPEFFSGQTDSQSDQYALGVTYCQLRGGRLPFTGSQADMIAGHLEAEPDLSMLPEAERPIVRRALAKEPSERWPNCPEFVGALIPALLADAEAVQRAANDLVAVDTLPLPPPDDSPGGVVMLLIFVLMLLPATWLLIEYVRNHRPEPPPIPHLALPAFQSLTLFPEQTFRLNVAVKRSNNPSPLELRLDGLPPGVKAAAVPIAEDASAGTLEVTVAADAAPGTKEVTLVVQGGKVEAMQSIALTITAKLEKEIVNSIGMKLVRIPAGQFVMGSPWGEVGRGDDENEKEGFIRAPFYMGVDEVTQREFQEVLKRNPSYHQWKAGEADLPVENVTWEDACRFCAALSLLDKETEHRRKYRLPGEGEWEYACRGGASSRTPFNVGTSLLATQANFDDRFPYGGAGVDRKFEGRTKPVGWARLPNAFGLNDMHGNVQEWCLDWYSRKARPDDPVREASEGSQQPFRVVRGGCYAVGAAGCRSAARGKQAAGAATPFTGFRVVMMIEPK